MDEMVTELWAERVCHAVDLLRAVVDRGQPHGWTERHELLPPAGGRDLLVCGWGVVGLERFELGEPLPGGGFDLPAGGRAACSAIRIAAVCVRYAPNWRNCWPVGVTPQRQVIFGPQPLANNPRLRLGPDGSLCLADGRPAAPSDLLAGQWAAVDGGTPAFLERVGWSIGKGLFIV